MLSERVLSMTYLLSNRVLSPPFPLAGQGVRYLVLGIYGLVG